MAYPKAIYEFVAEVRFESQSSYLRNTEPLHPNSPLTKTFVVVKLVDSEPKMLAYELKMKQNELYISNLPRIIIPGKRNTKDKERRKPTKKLQVFTRSQEI